MITNNIKQFSLSTKEIIIGEIISENSDHYELGNVLDILVLSDEENIFYKFESYYTEYLFPISMSKKLYFSSIVLESEPETPIMLNYIAYIREYTKQIKKPDFESKTLH